MRRERYCDVVRYVVRRRTDKIQDLELNFRPVAYSWHVRQLGQDDSKQIILEEKFIVVLHLYFFPDEHLFARKEIAFPLKYLKNTSTLDKYLGFPNSETRCPLKPRERMSRRHDRANFCCVD